MEWNMYCLKAVWEMLWRCVREKHYQASSSDDHGGEQHQQAEMETTTHVDVAEAGAGAGCVLTSLETRDALRARRELACYTQCSVVSNT